MDFETKNIKIEKVILSGDGLAHLSNNKVAFIPRALDEDIISIKNVVDKKSYITAEIDKIEKKSQYRIEPKCKYYLECGGCNLQHSTYEHQLNIKVNIVKEALKNFNNLQIDIESDECYNYRNRLRVVVKDNKFYLRKRKSQELIEIDNCIICEDKINQFLNYLKDERIFENENKEIQIFSTQSKIDYQEIQNYGAKDMSEFAQINTKINLKMIDYIKSITNTIFKNKIDILDLFCGNGNLSLPLLEKASTINGFDISHDAIKYAKSAIKTSQKKQYEYLEKDVYKILEKKLIKKNYDLVILDPPRKGLKKFVNDLLFIESKYIIYVSCSPADLARDLEVLTQKYSIESIKLFDMFPQTDHVESVVLMSKKDKY